MLGQDIERTVDIEDQIEPAEQRLVRADRRQAAAAEAVDHESRNSHRIELMHPGFDAAADAARSVHQHHHGQAAGTLRDTQFAGHGNGLAIGVAGQELLV